MTYSSAILRGRTFPARGSRPIWPDFTPFVAEYANNGLAKSEEEVAAYFGEYRKRAVLDFLKYRLERRVEAIYCSCVTKDSIAHRLAKRIYWKYKKTWR